MAKKESLTPLGRIEHLIQLIRDHRVILDADLARLYGVATKALNQAVKRNRKRFPPDSQSARTTPEEDRFSRARRPLHARSRAPGRSPVTPEQRAEITWMSQSGEDLSPEWPRIHSARRFTSG